MHWVPNFQTEISLSTLEAEYIPLYKAMCDILPLRRLIQEVMTQLNTEFASPAIMHYTVFEDKNGVLGLAKSRRTTPRTRHIAVKQHFLRDNVGKCKGIVIQRVDSKEQKANVFTKGFPAEKNQYIRKLLAGS